MTEQTRNTERNAPRFIADCHLGRLAKYLRFMGYDTLFFSHIEDDDLLALGRKEGRTVLTHDTALARRRNAPVHLLEPRDTATQLHALGVAFGLKLRDDAQRRCLVCNARLEEIDKNALGCAVPESVQAQFDFFQRCPACGRIYWRGDHYRRMKAFIESALTKSV